MFLGKKINQLIESVINQSKEPLFFRHFSFEISIDDL